MITETYYSEQVESALKHLKAYICIEVKNLSATTQTILEMGVVGDEGQRFPWREPEWMEPTEYFPMVLEPDQIGKAFLRIMSKDYVKLKPVVYVKTDCGECFQGDSPIVTDFFMRLKEECA